MMSFDLIFATVMFIAYVAWTVGYASRRGVNELPAITLAWIMASVVLWLVITSMAVAFGG